MARNGDLPAAAELKRRARAMERKTKNVVNRSLAVLEYFQRERTEFQTVDRGAEKKTWRCLKNTITARGSTDGSE